MRNHPSRSSALFLGKLCVLSALLATSGCESEAYTVSSTLDADRNSLRAAISTVNQRPTRPARIELPSGTYELTRCGMDVGNRAGDLDLNTRAPVTIVATGGPVTIRQTCAGERVLEALGTGTLTLIGVTLTGGTLTNDDPDAPAEGGGVRAAADLVLEAVTITGNSATGAPGESVASGTPVPGGAAQGGGVFVAAALRMTNASIVSNTATGGLGTDATTTDITPAPGGSAAGGGVYVVKAITVTGGRIAQNRAAGGVGGKSVLFPDGTPSPEAGTGGHARGGGVA
ncbi:MAG TPA: hypothetical protein VK524_17825, partial [Polyangiaceae bacterium]|nr:hypothetical protein [Polyangiaceae bacterium]